MNQSQDTSQTIESHSFLAIVLFPVSVPKKTCLQRGDSPELTTSTCQKSETSYFTFLLRVPGLGAVTTGILPDHLVVLDLQDAAHCGCWPGAAFGVFWLGAPETRLLLMARQTAGWALENRTSCWVAPKTCSAPSPGLWVNNFSWVVGHNLTSSIIICLWQQHFPFSWVVGHNQPHRD